MKTRPLRTLKFRVTSLVFFLLLTTQVSAKSCVEDLALLAGNPSFMQLAQRVVGLSLSTDAGNHGGNSRLALSTSDIENLFSDSNDPWMQRMGRYLTSGIQAGNINVELVGDKKETGYAAGTCWNSGCQNHDIKILLNTNLIGGNPTKNGIREAVRSTLIHEAMHARINDHLVKWLEQNYLDPVDWARRLETETEEFLVRNSDQRALGRTGINAKLRAWFSTLIDGGMTVNPWSNIQTAWTKKLRTAGIDIGNSQQRETRRIALEAQKESYGQTLIQEREWTLREIKGTESLTGLRDQLVRRGKITEQQWTELETAVVEELLPKYRYYRKPDLAQAVERQAKNLLKLTIKGDYDSSNIYGFNILTQSPPPINPEYLRR